MTVSDWNDGRGTEFIDIELHIRERTAYGYPAALSVPFVETFSEVLPEPPIRELQSVDSSAPSFGESAPALYGRLLFEWLFVGRLREGFLKSRQLVADSPCTRWRFRVRLSDRAGTKEANSLARRRWEADPLTALRWEALRYQKDGWWLGMETAFGRSRAAGGLTPLLVNDRPIQLFAATTSGANRPGVPVGPLSDILPSFNHHVMRPLGNLVETNFVHPPLSFDQLRDAYHESEPHCLVLCGAIDVDGTESAMWFDDGPNNVTAVPWKQVVSALCRSKPPQLVILMGPLYGSETAPSLAPELHDSMGVRSVVQVTGCLDNSGFKTFGEKFLKRLLKTGAVDEAVAFARRALHDADPNGWGWTVPILSLQTSSDGQLFYLLPENVESELGQLRNIRR
jgi:hypothetical protein